ncbi:hypothetical protein [Sphingomonas sp. SRS2]|uniref:hypothetical protein n=1 Tax=Sphingomonas sp. SRS2 TaxID=133190 RepID=UPI000B1FD23D|nr:hypothetical protein [Sphingomonas sp. SRS2]
MRIGPFRAGWRPIDRGEQHLIGLEGPWAWEIFELELFGFGFGLICRPVLTHG